MAERQNRFHIKWDSPYAEPNPGDKKRFTESSMKLWDQRFDTRKLLDELGSTDENLFRFQVEDPHVLGIMEKHLQRHEKMVTFQTVIFCACHAKNCIQELKN